MKEEHGVVLVMTIFSVIVVGLMVRSFVDVPISGGMTALVGAPRGITGAQVNGFCGDNVIDAGEDCDPPGSTCTFDPAGNPSTFCDEECFCPPTLTPTETPTPTRCDNDVCPTETPTETLRERPTETPTPTRCDNEVCPTETPTNTPTDTPTSTPCDGECPTVTPTETSTETPTETPTSTPCDNGQCPTETPTETPTSTPIGKGICVTPTPTETPTQVPCDTVADCAGIPHGLCEKVECVAEVCVIQSIPGCGTGGNSGGGGAGTGCDRCNDAEYDCGKAIGPCGDKCTAIGGKCREVVERTAPGTNVMLCRCVLSIVGARAPQPQAPIGYGAGPGTGQSQPAAKGGISEIVPQAAEARVAVEASQGMGQAIGAYDQRTNTKGAMIGGTLMVFGLLLAISALLISTKPPTPPAAPIKKHHGK